ncbi:MAG: hypothetical protein KKG91_03835, partial [Candidatus Omnitrophica bacterium]|nr:hypothetical protein [Candidatus Omnitrophota bacterium]
VELRRTKDFPIPSKPAKLFTSNTKGEEEWRRVVCFALQHPNAGRASQNQGLPHSFEARQIVYLKY